MFWLGMVLVITIDTFRFPGTFFFFGCVFSNPRINILNIYVNGYQQWCWASQLDNRANLPNATPKKAIYFYSDYRNCFIQHKKNKSEKCFAFVAIYAAQKSVFWCMLSSIAISFSFLDISFSLSHSLLLVLSTHSCFNPLG